jgi:hypothetical protein
MGAQLLHRQEGSAVTRFRKRLRSEPGGRQNGGGGNPPRSWPATMVAGSTLLSESIAVELRASAQGLSDLVMGLAGATAGAVSG